MKQRIACLMFIGALLLAVACDGDDGSSPGGTDIPDDCTVVEVNDDITVNTTWEYGNVYVINALDFYIEAELVIEPGVVVKFDPDYTSIMLDEYGGRIIAEGTSNRPVVFTSWYDDSYCGDTNDDGNATTPAVRDWDYIDTNGSSASSVFRYCRFHYGGGNSYYSTLRIYDSVATVDHCVFSHNRGTLSTYAYGALDATYANAGSSITNNSFFDNNVPLTIGTGFSVDNSNTFTDGSDTGNIRNGIFYTGTTHIERNVTWSETEVAFVIYFGILSVSSGCTLTLSDNVTVKFYAGDGLRIENGGVLSNYTDPTVLFTAFTDDTLKGDTNGDGSATSGTPGYWDGIYFNAGDTYYSAPGHVFFDSH